MQKHRAIEMLGGTVTAAATTLNVSYQAVNQWPADLPPRISDRVFAAIVRQHPRDWADIWPELAHPEPKEATQEPSHA